LHLGLLIGLVTRAAIAVALGLVAEIRSQPVARAGAVAVLVGMVAWGTVVLAANLVVLVAP
jgi:hypothetical protein